jgi:hypothetical protein
MFAVLFAAAAAVTFTTLPPADEADVRCLAYLSRAEGRTTGNLRSKVEGGALYYFGRLEARSPGLDVEREVAAILASPAYTRATYEADKARCHDQLDPLAQHFAHWRGTYASEAHVGG